jgi:hypothetical protein
MKKLNFILVILLGLTMACGTNTTQKTSDNEEVSNELDMKDGEVEKINDCDEFLDRYEKWVDDYLVVLEKYSKDPMDTANSQEFMKVAQEASGWAQQWTNNFYACVSQEKYQKRFEAMGEKVEKKMKELGLE